MVQGLGVVIGGLVQIFGDVEAGIGRLAEGIGKILQSIGSGLSVLPEWLGGGSFAAGIKTAGDDLVGLQATLQSTSDTTTATGRAIQNWAKEHTARRIPSARRCTAASDAKVLHLSGHLGGFGRHEHSRQGDGGMLYQARGVTQQGRSARHQGGDSRGRTVVAPNAAGVPGFVGPGAPGGYLPADGPNQTAAPTPSSPHIGPWVAHLRTRYRNQRLNSAPCLER